MKSRILAATKKRMSQSFPPAALWMVKFVLCMAFLAALGLAHVHLRILTRDMQIRQARLQAEWNQLQNHCNALKSAVSQLRDGDVLLSYAMSELDMVTLPADELKTWRIPQEMIDGYDRVYSEVALARKGPGRFAEREQFVVRLLGKIPWPVENAQARPKNPER